MSKAGVLNLKSIAFKNTWYVFLLTVWLMACSNNTTKFDGVDLSQWIKDPEGCNRNRIPMVPLILSQKDKILAQSESDVIKLLGKPDGVELYKRNQKLYHYRITPGPDCKDQDSLYSELLIRFNAMGRAKEIYSTPE